MKILPLLPVAVLLSACTAQTPSPILMPSVEPKAAPERVLHAAEVVHTSRYTLVNLAPDEYLRAPLRQIKRHSFSVSRKSPSLTRGEGLRAWLAGTGYGLCLPSGPDTRLLFSSPLPDVWRNTEPMRVDVALQAMAGSAWQMTTDEISRTVCFQRAPLASEGDTR